MFTIITPTFKRDPNILKRCLDSINAQTYKHWKHIVIIDDNKFEPHISKEILTEYKTPNRVFILNGTNSNNYGNTPRQKAISLADSGYIVFIDDDNVVFPNYLDTFFKAIHENLEKKVFICKIIHCGPLPSHFGEPPKILDGIPPKLQNIDTLQFCVDTITMKTYGWLDKGYMADGHTIQNICDNIDSIVFIDEILGVHL